MIDLALLLLRVCVGLLMLSHGVRKLSPALGGNGFTGSVSFMSRTGFAKPRLAAFASGIAEILGGALFIAGLGMPAAGMVLIATLTTAILTGSRYKGFWATNNGIEFPAMLLVTIAALSLAGPGVYSMDRLISPALTGLPWFGALEHSAGPAAVILGVLAGWAVATQARRPGSPGASA